MTRELGGNLLVAMEHFGGRITPVIGLTPLVSGILAKAGYSKADVKQYIYERALIPAKQFDEQLARVEQGYNLQESVKRGLLDRRFAELDRRWEAMRAHRSQVPPYDAMSPALREAFLATDRLRRVRRRQRTRDERP